MKGFKKFFLENCINGLVNLFETAKVKDYLDSNPNSEEVYKWLFTQEAIKYLVEKIDTNSLIKPLSVDKNGYLVLKKPRQHNPIFGVSYYEDGSSGNPIQHRIPCRITKLEKEDEENEIELERTDGKDFEEISYQMPTFPDWKSQRSKKKILVPANKIILVNNEKYLVYTRWLAYAIMKGMEKSDKTIDAYFRYFWENSKDKLIDSINNDKIISLLRTTETSPEFFFATKEQENTVELNYPDKVKKDIRGKEGGKGEVLIEFPNGWKWLNLNRGYCPDEGNAAGHCGNQGGIEKRENILSLRDAENRVYLTFTIDSNGYLVERKAIGNKKPDKSLHPYIVKLLADPIVKGIGVGSYLPENDFKLEDLSHGHLFYLKKHGSFVMSDSIDDDSEFNSELIKNIDNIGEYFEKLKKEYPALEKLKIKKYIYGEYFIVDYSPYLRIYLDDRFSQDEQEEGWLKKIARVINGTKSVDQNFSHHMDLPDFLKSNFLIFKKNQIVEIFDYIIKYSHFYPQVFPLMEHYNMYNAEDYENFLNLLKEKLKNINQTNVHDQQNVIAVSLFSSLIAILLSTSRDINLKIIFKDSFNKARTEGYLTYLNKYLFLKCQNGYGYFYQLFLNGDSLEVEKCIQPKNVYEIIKNKDPDIKTDENIDDSNIDSDALEYQNDTNKTAKVFMDEFEKNLKYLYYKH